MNGRMLSEAVIQIVNVTNEAHSGTSKPFSIPHSPFPPPATLQPAKKIEDRAFRAVVPQIVVMSERKEHRAFVA